MIKQLSLSPGAARRATKRAFEARSLGFSNHCQTPSENPRLLSLEGPLCDNESCLLPLMLCDDVALLLRAAVCCPFAVCCCCPLLPSAACWGCPGRFLLLPICRVLLHRLCWIASPFCCVLLLTSAACGSRLLIFCLVLLSPPLRCDDVALRCVPEKTEADFHHPARHHPESHNTARHHPERHHPERHHAARHHPERLTERCQHALLVQLELMKKGGHDPRKTHMLLQIDQEVDRAHPKA